MKDVQIIVAAITSIILFIFGLEHFSKEIQRISGEKFRKFLGRATRYSGVGILIGAVVTTFVQSSSATSVIAISLVNAGVLSFKNSVGIVFGANIGTTVTAQLVAFKLTSFAPVFIILGFGLSFIRSKYSIFAKVIFYFGFVFFSLNLISSSLAPLQGDERLLSYLTGQHNPFYGLVIGALITAVVQSSSVTTGLTIIFAQQGLISLENAIPILMGANIGTTATALLSIFSMDISAKKTALAHFFFNIGGVVLFFPFIGLFGNQIPLFSDDKAVALANFHLIFNVGTTLVFFVLLKPFVNLIDRILGEGKMDFERFDLSFFNNESDFQQVEKHLLENLSKSYKFTQENYNLVTLSIESNYRGVYEVAKKRLEYFEFVRLDLMNFFSQSIGKSTQSDQINRLVGIMKGYEYIFQIHDSVKDIAKIKEAVDENYLDLKSDVLIVVRELSSATLSFFESADAKPSKEGFKAESHKFQAELDGFNTKLLKMMAQPDRNDVGIILQLATYSQRLKDKLVNYYKLDDSYETKNT